MKTTLSEESMQKITDALKPAHDAFAARYPGESGRRQPVHTVYGGAHLFKSDTVVKLGSLAVRSVENYAPDAKTFAAALDLPANSKHRQKSSRPARKFRASARRASRA